MQPIPTIKGMQYTIRNISKKADQILRRRAKNENKSLQQVAREALELGAGIVPLGKQPVKYRDLSDIAGTYVHDPGFEEAMRDQDQVDPRDWE